MTIGRESGQGRVGCTLWVLLLALVVLIGWKAIPVKIKSAELHDFMVEQAKWAGRAPPEVIKRNIMGKAVELDLPVDKKKIVVVNVAGRIRMRCTYTVPINILGYTYDWDFNHEVDRPVFFF